jgi:hypothetical protein
MQTTPYRLEQFPDWRYRDVHMPTVGEYVYIPWRPVIELGAIVEPLTAHLCADAVWRLVDAAGHVLASGHTRDAAMAAWKIELEGLRASRPCGFESRRRSRRSVK